MDIQNTDKISMVVKREKVDEICEYYSAFGWELFEIKEDKRYGNIIHLSFKRVHFINEKDKLQLYQVRMENAVNSLAKAENNKHSVSALVGVILGAISLLLLVLGVKLIFNTDNSTLWISIVSFVLGIAFSVFNVIFCKMIYKRENTEFAKTESENKSKIRENCNKGREILENNEKIKLTITGK